VAIAAAFDVEAQRQKRFNLKPGMIALPKVMKYRDLPKC